MGGYQLLITGDCLYTLRHLAADDIQAVRFSRQSGDEQVRSIRKIASLKKLLPGLHLVVGHDHTEYQRKYLTPYLGKGWLNEDERRAMSQYEATLFDDDLRLRPEAVPHFQPGPDGATVGTVSEPCLA